VKSLLLISVLLAGLAIPIAAARDANPRRGVRRMFVLLLAFNVAYVVYLTFLHVRWFVPTR
jgi:hypothetical protein